MGGVFKGPRATSQWTYHGVILVATARVGQAICLDFNRDLVLAGRGTTCDRV